MQHLESSTSAAVVDTLAVEEPLEIRINGEPFLVTSVDAGERHRSRSRSTPSARTGRPLWLVRPAAGARYCDGAGSDGRNSCTTACWMRLAT